MRLHSLKRKPRRKMANWRGTWRKLTNGKIAIDARAADEFVFHGIIFHTPTTRCRSYVQRASRHGTLLVRSIYKLKKRAVRCRTMDPCLPRQIKILDHRDGYFFYRNINDLRQYFLGNEWNFNFIVISWTNVEISLFKSIYSNFFLILNGINDITKFELMGNFKIILTLILYLLYLNYNYIRGILYISRSVMTLVVNLDYLRKIV